MCLTDILIQIAAVITAIGVLGKFLKKLIKSNTREIMERLNVIDYNGCKSYLTDFLTEIENGGKKSSVQVERASEVYDHYVKNLNGNSYITTKWEKLMK